MSVDLTQVIEEIGPRPANPFYRRFPATVPRLRYLIAMTPRSGSTLLARQLSANDIGHPQEFLNEAFILRFGELFPNPSLGDFENFVLSHYTSADGIFGVKADWSRFSAARSSEYLPGLHCDFDVYVYLTRKDLLSQAISLAIATQSGLWEEVQTRYVDRDKLYRNVEYDEAMIIDNVSALMEQEYQWTKFLQRVRQPVLRLTYEQIAADTGPAVATIASTLGLKVPYDQGAVAAPAIQPVPSRVNSEWRLRFLARHRSLIQTWTRARGLRPGT